MKKLISILLALALCCMMIPALAEDGITGDWYGDQEIANDAEPIVFIFKIEMLQDGMIAMSMDMGYGASIYYLSKVEAE